MYLQKELNSYSDELAEIHFKLAQYKSNLNAAWVAPEVCMLNDALDRLNLQINRMREALDSLGADIVRAEDDIEAEKRDGKDEGKE